MFDIYFPRTAVLRQRGMGSGRFLRFKAAYALPRVIVINHDMHGEPVIFFLLRMGRLIGSQVISCAVTRLETM